VLAHEAGHILSEHTIYRTALLILLQLGSSVRLPLLAGLPLLAVRASLLEWFRASELSCDRAATLVNRDPLITCRTLMVLAGGRSSKKLNLDAFLRQAAEYEDWEPGLDRMRRFFLELQLTHSFPVRRVSELQKCVRSGEYDRLVGGAGAWEAEDAAQEALLDVSRAIGSLRDPSAVTAWALRIAARRALKAARRQRLTRLGRGLDAASELAVEADPRTAELKRA